MSGRALLWVGLLGGCLTGCLQSSTTECNAGRVCPGGTVCDEQHQLCVRPDQLSACDGLADGQLCSTATRAGICDAGICLPGCGDGVPDEGACDDGNYASHDGCSSTCVPEAPTWTEWNGEWSARSSHAASYDSDRDVLVVFGGVTGLGRTAEHWELDNADNWQRLAGPAPPPRSWSSMAYDAQRHVTVLFGGFVAGQGASSDTWEFDGSTWQEVSPLASPPARSGSAMLFDSASGKVVLFGGLGNGVYLDDTWEYDGTTWLEVNAETRPPGRRLHSFVWDAKNERGVLFGGRTPAIVNDTWAYQSGAWAEITIVGDPPSNRYDAQMAYSPQRERIVLFGGIDGQAQAASDTLELTETNTWEPLPIAVSPPGRGGGMLAEDPQYDPTSQSRDLVLVAGAGSELALDDVWRLQIASSAPGRLWRQSAPPDRPLPRGLAQMVYDSKNREVLLIGGFNGREGGNAALSTVFAFDGTTWKPRPSLPAGRYWFSATYDQARERTVVFGGQDKTGDTLGTTLEGNGESWTERTGPGPGPRRFSAMAYDSARNVTVMFGGLSDAQVTLDETWELDNDGWKRIDTTGPPAQMSPTMTYDPRLQATVLVDDEGLTWSYDGSSWSKHDVESTPPPRTEAKMVFDPARGRVLLYGGTRAGDYLGDLWELVDLQSGWQEIVSVNAPPAAEEPALVAHVALRKLVLFGGRNSSLRALGSTWMFQFDSATPDETCDNDVDDDGDGLVDAEDPDCDSGG